MQVFDRTRAIKLFQYATQSYTEDYEVFNNVVRELKDLALRDIKLEGFREEDVRFALDLEMRYGMQYNYTKIESPHLEIHSLQDVKDICERFSQTYARVYTPEAAFPQGGINVENFYLKAIVPARRAEMLPGELAGETLAAAAYKGRRLAYFMDLGGFRDTDIYVLEALLPGNVISGPAVIEASDTTCVVNPGWRFTMDVHRHGILERL
jgi:N-methylhydantoinase A/acetophenone carboxylase